jgi:hypothetical protein
MLLKLTGHNNTQLKSKWTPYYAAEKLPHLVPLIFMDFEENTDPSEGYLTMICGLK